MTIPVNSKQDLANSFGAQADFADMSNPDDESVKPPQGQ
jgi:hypothetical protein